jgi:excisionase family DNA binding protein
MESPTRRRWISPKEFSEILGISYKNTYALINRGELPARRVGRLIRIDFQAFEQGSSSEWGKNYMKE